MKVFVAGGTGALGHRVVRTLAEAGHEVTATARRDDWTEYIKRVGARPVDVDLFDPAAIRNVIAGQDAVLRLSTKIPPLMHMRHSESWIETGRLRTEGAKLLVDASIIEGVGTYVHESIAFVYADGGDAWLDESSPLDVEKARPLREAINGEANATRFTKWGGRGIVLRFAGFYSGDSTQSLAMADMARRRRTALIGPSRNYFSSIHLDDAASAVVASVQAPAGVYNVSDDEPLELRDFMRAMALASGAKPPRRLPGFLGSAVLGEVWTYLSRSLRVRSDRLRTATGWAPQIPNAREGWQRIAAEWEAASPTAR
jgi:nucleoside-diphosphate-sugar epimerase